MTSRAALLPGALAAALALACGGNDLVLPTGTPAAVDPRAGDGQTAAAGTAVAVPPSVVVRDDNGGPVLGVTVTFTASAGGGTVSGATQTTDQDGVATVGGWTLGTAAGPNTLEASVTATDPVDGNPVVFSATGVPGPASPVESIAQVPTNVFLLDPEPIQLETRDQFGNRLAQGGDDIDATAIANGIRVTLPVTDNADGTYTASTDDLAPARYDVEILLNGTPLEGSPFPMRVRLF